ncbi:MULTISPECIES: helix-turn-helix transcriptional regulator [unclassified Roseovarius]|uniref:helix-turn-helix transcriptional regulator n=1 Tax=unclassified Roseovarius TaxID=2614913 RepID=UPI00273D663F|nr:MULTISPECIES: helix-turn-helix transcriptional regulator [unclassified Roseovarius]
MAESSIIGTRIRERRIQQGIRQSELAKQVGISPSYLNLIEHNRRRIGGKILNRLAEVLEVEPSLLSEGAEAELIATLNEAAAGRSGAGERAEEFAGRFPGWAQLLAGLHHQNATLEQSVRTLTDRLTHDPHLAASLHDVISTVTSIRSTASILVETKELEPEWQGRFHRNINEDSTRLAEGAEALVRYLEAAPDTGAEIKSPQDELHAFLSEKGFHFPALEGEASDAMVEVVLQSADSLQSEAARQIARDVLYQYRRDAEALPLRDVLEAVGRHGVAPERLSEALKTDLATLFRRLAMLPEAEVGLVGLAICDGSGTLIFRKPLPEFSMPPVGSACTLWPLYQVLAQPQTPVRALVRQVGRDAQVASALAVSEEVRAASFSQPALMRAHMLILPAAGAAQDDARDVGVTCRICPLATCAARREPSIIEGGF